MAKEKRYFQWIKGEEAGEVEVLKDIRYEMGQYFFDFVSGESVNMDYIAPMTNSSQGFDNKVMVEIADPYDKWIVKKEEPRFELATPEGGEEQSFEIPSISDIANAGSDGVVSKSTIGSIHYKAPKFRGPFKPLPDPADYMTPDNSYVIEQRINSVKNARHDIQVTEIDNTVKEPVKIEKPKEIIEPVKEPEHLVSRPGLDITDPVYILLNTSKKEEKAVDITVNLSLPSKDLYKLITMQFENGKEKFEAILTDMLKKSMLDEKSVIEPLRTSIISAYEES